MEDNQNPPTPTLDPAERNAWKFGFTPQAEIWNGRFAMIGFFVTFLSIILSSNSLL
ncbi:MAG: high light inducible protein [Hormoscilla sp. GUM202]|nr:high light inducible protein [Hormoscilla sp. GUM202]